MGSHGVSKLAPKLCSKRKSRRKLLSAAKASWATTKSVGMWSVPVGRHTRETLCSPIVSPDPHCTAVGVAEALLEEPYALIAHVRVCGGAGWVTIGSTRQARFWSSPDGWQEPIRETVISAAHSPREHKEEMTYSVTTFTRDKLHLRPVTESPVF